MTQTTDSWYVRFPDGRVLRAASTAVVRQNLETGRIPANSTFRRSAEEEWQSLEWTREFADLREGPEERVAQVEPVAPSAPPANAAARRSSARQHQPASVASRLDPTQLQTVGVGQAIQELVAALDSTLVQRKLIVAVAAGLALGVLLGFPVVATLAAEGSAALVTRCVIAIGAWLIGALSSALLTRMTYVEVSRLRPARWSEAVAGIGWLTFRIAMAQLFVFGGTIGIIYILRQAPSWIAGGPLDDSTGLRQLLATWAVVLSLVLEVGAWPVFGLALLLAPVLVVENCSIWHGCRKWLALIQEDLGRAFLYEALALGLSLVIAGPLIAPLIGTANLYWFDGHELTATFTRIVLVCLVLAPVAAYLLVANVFIYLNLRYETGWRRG